MVDNRDYIRVRKGMCFWYNINANIDKLNVPKNRIVLSDGKIVEVQDNNLYGMRPWVVVSDMSISDERSILIAPMTTGKALMDYDNDNKPYHYKISFIDGYSVIMLEQIRHATEIEMQKYICTLKDSVVDEIDDRLKYVFGLKRVEDKSEKSDAEEISNIETIIGNSVKNVVKSIYSPENISNIVNQTCKVIQKNYTEILNQLILGQLNRLGEIPVIDTSINAPIDTHSESVINTVNDNSGTKESEPVESVISDTEPVNTDNVKSVENVENNEVEDDKQVESVETAESIEQNDSAENSTESYIEEKPKRKRIYTVRKKNENAYIHKRNLNKNVMTWEMSEVIRFYDISKRDKEKALMDYDTTTEKLTRMIRDAEVRLNKRQRSGRVKIIDLKDETSTMEEKIQMAKEIVYNRYYYGYEYVAKSLGVDIKYMDRIKALVSRKKIYLKANNEDVEYIIDKAGKDLAKDMAFYKDGKEMTKEDMVKKYGFNSDTEMQEVYLKVSDRLMNSTVYAELTK